MLYLLSHLAGLALLALAFERSGWLAGEAGLARRGLVPAGIAGRILLGAGLWTAALFVLAATGTLGRIELLTALLLLAVATLVTGLRRGWGWTTPQRPARPSIAVAIVGAAIGIALVAAFLRALDPLPAWDAQAYHLTLPRLWLAQGGFVRVPFNVYSNWPLAIELLFALGLALQDHLLATLVHFGSALLLLALLAEGVRDGGELRRLQPLRAPVPPLAVATALALLLANDVVLFELGAAYVDLAVALLLFAAWRLAERDLANDGGESGALLAAGACLGWLAGTKPSGLFGLAAIGIVWLVAAARRGRGAAPLARGALRLALPALAGALLWLARAWAQTGNPVYPFLYGIFGGPEWNAALGAQLAAWHRSIGGGSGAGDLFLLPLRVLVSGGPGYARFDGRLGFGWLAALPLVIAFARRRPGIVRPLAAAALWFLLWAATSRQMRLLIPLLPLLALAAGRALGDLLALPARPSTRRWLEAAVALLAVAAFAGPLAREGRLAPTLLGQYLRHGGSVREMAVPPVWRFVATLPPAARLVALNTNQVFFAPCPVLADSFFEASQLSSWLGPARTREALVERLAAGGVTHVLVDHRPRGVRYAPIVERLLAGEPLLPRLWRSPDGRFEVLEVR